MHTCHAQHHSWWEILAYLARQRILLASSPEASARCPVTWTSYPGWPPAFLRALCPTPSRTRGEGLNVALSTMAGGSDSTAPKPNGPSIVTGGALDLRLLTATPLADRARLQPQIRRDRDGGRDAVQNGRSNPDRHEDDSEVVAISVTKLTFNPACCLAVGSMPRPSEFRTTRR